MTIPSELDTVLQSVWANLEAGIRSGHPFHVPVLGTGGADAGSDQRMVVLRDVDRSNRRIFINTDRRSPKIDVIEKDPRVSWLFYDPPTKTQVRIRGVAHVHRDDAIADAHWQRATLRAKRCYLGRAPGDQSDVAITGLPDELTDREPTEDESRPGRANFAVISATIESLDWLELAFAGHRRARFRWTAEGTLDATWVAP